MRARDHASGSPLTRADQVVVHRASGQQRRDGRLLLVHGALVRQDHALAASAHSSLNLHRLESVGGGGGVALGQSAAAAAVWLCWFGAGRGGRQAAQGWKPRRVWQCGPGNAALFPTVRHRKQPTCVHSCASASCSAEGLPAV